MMSERGLARRAHKDLTTLLEAVKGEHGLQTARTAAETLRTATKEGRLDGGTYGTERHGVGQIACVLGWVTVTILGEECFGDSPHGLDAFMEENADGYTVGARVENYVLNVSAGQTPATNHRAANIARWCGAFAKANDDSRTRS